MSVSDPLIKDIKGCILKFLEAVKETGYISDASPTLVPFCENVEKAFNNGISTSHSAFGFTKQTDPWIWLEKVSSVQDSFINFGYISSVEYVQRYQTILSPVGKLRLLIRNCLVQKSLHVPVEYLIKYKKHDKIYRKNSILGDEILSEIYLSLLRQCSRMAFRLDLSNTSFLSKSWVLPEVFKLELVPCKNLGISVSFSGNKAVIVNIESNSVISEYSKVEIGDVLDNLNGVHICLATKGRLSTVLRSCKGQPITMTIIKAKQSDSNEYYLPIINLLKQIHLDPAELQNKNNLKNFEANLGKKTISSAGFNASYMGYVNMGKNGDVKQIDKAVKLLLSPYKHSNHSNYVYKVIKKSIHFEVGEIGVKLVDSESSEVLEKHSYMEISSCGSVTHMPFYFAYIAGNESCNQATSFTCYVFHIKNTDLVYTILQSIGQGFQRTHFAV